MERIKKLERILIEQNLDGLFLIKETNVRYLSGFTGAESYVIVSPRGRGFLTDSRYTEQAEKECEGFEIINWCSPHANLPEAIRWTCEKLKIGRLGFEKGSITVGLYEKIKKALGNIEFVGTSGLVEEIRRVKSDGEIEYIRKAAYFADKAFEEILNYVKVGVSEKELERELQYITKKLGADDIGFPAIIASGKNTSLPHAIPSDKLIEEGDFVTFDMGALYRGYRSDMTRTIVVGHASERQKQVYEVVKQSQEKAAMSVKNGVDGKIPHFIAKDIIKQSGIEGVFEYGVGHGVGLDIHEDPFMGASCELMLETGNVITIEPGIYIPGWGGVRIEDTVIVKEDGFESITLSPKELIII